MLFSSLEFLYLFMPMVLLVYFLSPLRWRNIVLLIFSLIFYGWGEPVLCFSDDAHHLIGLCIRPAYLRKSDNKPKARRYLIGRWSAILRF